MLTNYISSFNIEETWQKFYNNWHWVLYNITKPIFQEKWAEFQIKYKIDYWIIINYLQNDLIAA